MKRWIQVFAIGSLSAASSIGSAQTPEAFLLESLQKRYPAVIRWEIQPLRTDSQPLQSIPPSARIARLGSRSAVRIGPYSYWYAVKGMQPVLVAARRIAASEALDTEAGKIVARDLFATGCEPFSDLAPLNGMRAARQLHTDQVICPAFVESRPAVSRGEQVIVHYRTARVALTAKAVAQADGALGDWILVKSSLGHSPFRARVTAEKEATVHE